MRHAAQQHAIRTRDQAVAPDRREAVSGYFADDARWAVATAHVEARLLGHPLISPEHLLLGLLADDNAAATVLASLGFTRDRVREQIVALTGRGTHRSDLLFSADVLKIFQVAYLERRGLGCRIGSDHLLLGLVEVCVAVPDCTAARILDDLLLSVPALRQHLHNVATPEPGRRTVPARHLVNHAVATLGLVAA